MMQNFDNELEERLHHVRSTINIQKKDDVRRLVSEFKKESAKTEELQETSSALYLFYEILFDLSIVYHIDREWLIAEGISLIRAAQHQGNARAESFLFMRLGILAIWLNKEQQALAYFEDGIAIAADIDDADLTQELIPYVIVYKTILGDITTIKKQMRKLGAFSSLPPSYFSRFFFLVFLSLTLTVMGDFEMGRQVLTLSYQFAIISEASHTKFSTLALLATVYSAMQLFDKAEKCFEEMDEVSDTHILPEAQFWRFRSQAFYHFSQKEYAHAHDFWLQARAILETGVFIPYTSRPNFLEMLYVLYHEQGYNDLKEDFEDTKQRFLTSRNRYLCGYAHVLQAREIQNKTGSCKEALQELRKAEEIVVPSGATLVLIEMYLEYARCAKIDGENSRAKEYVQKAWNLGLSRRAWQLPDDLQSFTITTTALSKEEISWRHFQRFLSLNKQLSGAASFNELLQKAHNLLCSFFKAESAAVFRQTFQGDFSCIQATNPKAQSFVSEIIEEISEENLLRETPYINDTIKTGRLYEDSHILHIPISLPRRIIFVIEVQPQIFLDLEEEELKTLAQHISRAFHTNFQLFQDARKVAPLLPPPRIDDNSTGSTGAVWKSPIMKQVFALADIAAKTDASVLLLGETGTGKTMLAEYIHQQGKRQTESYVAVDIGSLSESLIESELFGHEKGAFTGALQKKQGYIEAADGGTLFLDEIGEIPMPIQAKMLRMLQDKIFSRVGGTRELSSDFRLISATNIKFEDAITEKKFREDLYYRINVIPITLPPLRQRPEDIITLTNHFFDHFATKHHLPKLHLPPLQEEAVATYAWPGNVRELKNYAERATIMQTTDIGTILSAEPFFEQEDDNDDLHHNGQTFDAQELHENLPSMAQLQRDYIEYLLERTGRKMSGKNSVSEILDMKRTTLYNRLNKLNIKY